MPKKKEIMGYAKKKKTIFSKTEKEYIPKTCSQKLKSTIKRIGHVNYFKISMPSERDLRNK